MIADRGLKPTATFGGRSATKTKPSTTKADRASLCRRALETHDVDGGVGVAGDEVAAVVGEGEFVDSAGEGQAFFDDSAGEIDDLHSDGGSVLPERRR